MNRVILFGLIGIMTATSANAGWFDKLLGKEKEPATLEEACNKDDLKTICPEILLGTMTTTECITQNATKLSEKCVAFVKKQASEKIESVKSSVSEKVSASKSEPAVSSDATAKVEAAKAKAETAKADAAAKKEAAQASAKEISNAAKQTGNDLKETGKSLKSMF